MGVCIRVILALLGGAVINIAVAELMAVWPSERSVRVGSVVAISASELPASAAAYLNDPGYLSSFGPGRATGLKREIGRSVGSTTLRYRRWHDDESGFGYSRYSEFLRYGLPMRSLQRLEHSSFNIAAYPEYWWSRAEGIMGGWPLGPDPSGYFTARPARIYPLAPVPAGFAVNTLVYAAALYPMLLLPGRFRRLRRRARGLCAFCAYPRGGSALCPECGRGAAGA